MRYEEYLMIITNKNVLGFIKSNSPINTFRIMDICKTHNLKVENVVMLRQRDYYIKNTKVKAMLLNILTNKYNYKKG